MCVCTLSVMPSSSKPNMVPSIEIITRVATEMSKHRMNGHERSRSVVRMFDIAKLAG